jgi:predicted nucleic acid-binding protein
MTSVEPGVLDANVVAYAINADAAQHVAARTLLEAARDPPTSLYVTSQILCEFYSIITNVRRFPKAVSPAEEVRILSTILALPGLQILPMTLFLPPLSDRKEPQADGGRERRAAQARPRFRHSTQ